MKIFVRLGVTSTFRFVGSRDKLPKKDSIFSAKVSSEIGMAIGIVDPTPCPNMKEIV